MLISFRRFQPFFLSFLWFLTLTPAAAQEDSPQKLSPIPQRRIIEAVRTNILPTIDGIIDEAVWQKAPVATDFVLMEPNEGQLAEAQTEVRILYDDDNLYFGIRCWEPEPEKIVAELHPRDTDWFYPNDLFQIIIDTYRDHQNAYHFRINPLGVRADATSRKDGREDYDNSWDAVWEAKTHIDDKGWTAEVVIPFKALRFPNTDVQLWGINFGRYRKNGGEDSAWSPISLDDHTWRKVSKAGDLVGLRRIRPGRHLEIRPYLRSRGERRGSRDRDKFNPGVGIDVKYGFTPSTILDFTLHPDFAQIEADPNQINLTRFELFLQERRPFFLESYSLFQTPFNLFYSRRINNPLAGARLTGKKGRFNYGLIEVIDDEKATHTKPVFSIGRANLEILRNSNIGVLGAVKTIKNGKPSIAVGLDGNLYLSQTDFVEWQIAQTFTSGTKKQGKAAIINYNHQTDRYSWGSSWEFVQPDFDVNVTGFFNKDPGVGSNFFSGFGRFSPRLEKNGIQNIVAGIWATAGRNTDDEITEWRINTSFGSTLMNRDEIWLYCDAYRESFVSRFNKGKMDYRQQRWGLAAWLPSGRWLRGFLDYSYGDQFDFGDEILKISHSLYLDLAFQPVSYFTFDFGMNVVWFSLRDGSRDEARQVFNSRLTYLFNTELFVRIFTRYGRDQNTDVNFLLGWEYLPGSFLYLAINQSIKSATEKTRIQLSDRLAILKLSYFFNY